MILENIQHNKISTITENNIVECSTTVEKYPEVFKDNTSEGVSEEVLMTENSSIENHTEVEDSNLLVFPIVLVINDKDSNVTMNILEEENTSTLQKKKRDKKDTTNRKLELTRAAPYKKPRNGVQDTQI
jgi:hypothetical protein